MRTVFAGMVVVLLSGCLGASGDGNGSIVVEDPPPSLRLDEAMFEGCQDYATSTRDQSALIDDGAYGPPPPGWGKSNFTSPLILLNFRVCDHVGYHGIERGPVAFMTETHYWPTAPDECVEKMQENNSSSPMLQGLWFDDPEVAAAFESGMNRSVGVFNLDVEADLSPKGTYHIQWTINGTPAGDITIHSVDDGSPTVERGSTQAGYWDNGQGISAIKQDDVFMIRYIFQAQAIGTVMEPHHNPYPDGHWNDIGTVADSTVTFSIHHFEDYQCTEPSSD